MDLSFCANRTLKKIIDKKPLASDDRITFDKEDILKHDYFSGNSEKLYAYMLMTGLISENMQRAQQSFDDFDTENWEQVVSQGDFYLMKDGWIHAQRSLVQLYPTTFGSIFAVFVGLAGEIIRKWISI